MKSIFISYSYEDEQHNTWVLNLANKLEEKREFHIIYDKYDLGYKEDKNLFMQQAITNSDIIIIIASTKYIEKSNDMKGGVGVETSMIRARHFKEMEQYKKSNIIPVLKSNSEKKLPDYLENVKLRLNFDSNTFDANFQQLTNAINDIKISRPKKTSQNISKDFKTADNILSINYKNRKLLNSFESDKIKFEYWECLSPAKLYFLALFPNKNITDSISHFTNCTIDLPSELTVLKEKESNTAEKTFQELLPDKSPKIHEYSYSKYLWELCIDQNFKTKEKISTEPNYIQQDIFYYSNDEGIQNIVSKSFLEDFINNDKDTPIIMLLATGGKGKTTLIENLIDNINQNEQKKCIYISSEEFKEHFSNNSFNLLTEISTIYDLYNIHTSIDSTPYSLDKNTFEIGLSNGNIIVILDGLDEIVTLYQNKFKFDSFISSLIKLNKDFGKCKIIISSRENYSKKRELLENNNIITLTLNGFDDGHIKLYINKRFKLLMEDEPTFYTWEIERKYKSLIENFVSQVMKFTDKKSLSPFIIDIICTSVEIELKSEIDKFEIESEYDYPCNDDIIDKIIFSILKRETRRQQFGYLNTNDIADILINLAISYGEVFTIENLKYEIDYKNYTSISNEVLSSLKISQLLEVNGNKISFKYDVLVNYFICLYILKLFSDFKAYNSIRLKNLAKLYNIENPIFKEIKKYFTQNNQLFLENAKLILEKIIQSYKNISINPYEKILTEQSIYSIIFLLIEINPQIKTAKGRMELIKDLYQIKNQKIEYLFILDSFVNLDFTNLEIWNSKFDNYSQFLHSDFNNTKFLYTSIKNIKAKKDFNEKLAYINFDETCELFDLIKDEDKLTKIESLNKFLRNFYDKNFKQFLVQQKKKELNTNKYINLLLENDFIEIIKGDKNYVVYEIKENKKAIIRKYIKEGTKSIEIISLLNKIDFL